MKLINTDGMAVIGPGSEWFWTAVSGIVLAITFFAIYRQLRLARSAGAWEQLESIDRELTSERLTRCKLEVFLALRDGADPRNVPRAAAIAIAGFWEKVAALARSGHLDQRLLYSFNGGACPVWWVALAPYIQKLRADAQDPTEYQQFEWLAGTMSELDRRGGAVVVDKAWLASQLDSRIAGFQDQLRLEQALRTVIVASPDALSVRPDVRAAVPTPVAMEPAT